MRPDGIPRGVWLDTYRPTRAIVRGWKRRARQAWRKYGPSFE